MARNHQFLVGRDHPHGDRRAVGLQPPRPLRPGRRVAGGVDAHAEEILKIQTEVTDYHEMVNAVKGHLAEAKVFRPEILGRIDKVYVFPPLKGIVVAEVALLKIAKLAKEYSLSIQFVAPELIMRVLIANEKVSRFGIRELDRVLSDLVGRQLMEAREAGATKVTIEADDAGAVRVTPVAPEAKAP